LTRIIQESFLAKNADFGNLFQILYMHSESQMTENGVFQGVIDVFTLNWISELIIIDIQVAPRPQRDV